MSSKVWLVSDSTNIYRTVQSFVRSKRQQRERVKLVEILNYQIQINVFQLRT